jgi:2-polyprenyl-6-methoxyphenol hydroxylase-like FAD-dependent oxidoreductase
VFCLSALVIEQSKVAEILHTHAVKAGVQFSFRKHVVRVNDDGTRPSVELEEGPRISADLIIAADGKFSIYMLRSTTLLTTNL